MGNFLRPALRLIVVLSVLTGLAYPWVVTGMAQLFFPHSANGSLIYQDGELIGSEWVGQPFNDPAYFAGRPSATTPPYDGGASLGSNLGPLHPSLHTRVAADVARWRATGGAALVPIDLVTASASGLDPHLTPAGARYQVARVAQTRGRDEREVLALVERFTEGRQFGLLGEPRVHVLKLNLALDALPQPATPQDPGQP